MRISDWSSDVCSSDLRSSLTEWNNRSSRGKVACAIVIWRAGPRLHQRPIGSDPRLASGARHHGLCRHASAAFAPVQEIAGAARSEEHTSELQSLMRISYAVFCLKKKKKTLT